MIDPAPSPSTISVTALVRYARLACTRVALHERRPAVPLDHDKNTWMRHRMDAVGGKANVARHEQ